MTADPKKYYTPAEYYELEVEEREGMDAVLDLDAIKAKVGLADIYANVDFKSDR